MDKAAQQVAEINELREGIFQVAMLLFKEYSKYMSDSDARVCVFRDLADKAKAFLEKDIEGSSTADIAKRIIESKIKEIEKKIGETKDRDLQLRLDEDADTLAEALGILNT